MLNVELDRTRRADADRAVRALAARARAVAAREITYLKEDVRKARDAATSGRRAAASVVLGVVVVVYSIGQWMPVIAGVLAGGALLAYGFLFVDLDDSPRGRRRR